MRHRKNPPIYFRPCPSCGKELSYTTRKVYNRSVQENRLCTSCCRKGDKHHAWKGYDTKYTCPTCGKELHFTNEGNLQRAQREKTVCKSCAAKGRISKLGVSSAFVHSSRMSGRSHTSDTKRKMRLSTIRFINEQNGGCTPRFNPVACQRIDEYGQKHGYNFQHAMNGGEYFVKELGYWLDGYDKEKNVVIEYYEPWHNNPTVKQHDLQRKRELIKFIKPNKFIELREK